MRCTFKQDCIERVGLGSHRRGAQRNGQMLLSLVYEQIEGASKLSEFCQNGQNLL